jgi:hypothetical protein
MQAARAARAVDQLIHKHLQDWDSDGSRFEWAEGETRFTLATYFTQNTPAAVSTGAPKYIPHLTLQADGDLPVEYPGQFGCTGERIEEIAFWLKPIVELTVETKEFLATL